MSETKDAWDVLSALQHPPVFLPPVPPLDLVTAEDILTMLPPTSKGNVGVNWVRKNIPGKRRVGRQDLWPRQMVVDYFSGANDPR